MKGLWNTCELKWKSLSYVWLFSIPWMVAYQAPLSMELTRQEFWSGLPFPPPGDFPHPGMEPRYPALQADSLLFDPPGLFYYRFVFSFPLYNTRSFSEFRQVLPADISSASLKSCLIAASIIFTPLIFLALWKGEYFKYLPWALQHLQDKLMTFSTLNLISRGNPCAHSSDSCFLIPYETYICPLLYTSASHQPFGWGHERDWDVVPLHEILGHRRWETP